MRSFLAAELLPELYRKAAATGEVHGPVRCEDGKLRLRRTESFAELQPGLLRTALPAKKYLIPPRETTLRFDGEHYHSAAATPPRITLFCLPPCELAAVAYLDRVFLGESLESCYAARRRELVLLGISCTPDDACRCDRTGCTLPPVFDLFLQEIPGGYLVATGSKRGKELLSGIPLAEGEDFAGPQPFPPRKPPAPEPPEELLADFARRCLSCGACSVCCPTCYCYNVREDGSLSGKEAERFREWDNCLFEGHGRVAGHDFRPDRKERFRYRYRHKVHGFGPLNGVSSCVGCGRCAEACPAGIDLPALGEARP